VRLAGERDASLPERFADASSFRHKPVKQHACYITSNNVYGVKQVRLFASLHLMTASMSM
jgi:hypothetical protein